MLGSLVVFWNWSLNSFVFWLAGSKSCTKTIWPCHTQPTQPDHTLSALQTPCVHYPQRMTLAQPHPSNLPIPTALEDVFSKSQVTQVTRTSLRWRLCFQNFCNLHFLFDAGEIFSTQGLGWVFENMRSHKHSLSHICSENTSVSEVMWCVCGWQKPTHLQLSFSRCIEFSHSTFGKGRRNFVFNRLCGPLRLKSSLLCGSPLSGAVCCFLVGNSLRGAKSSVFQCKSGQNSHQHRGFR